MTGRIRPRHHQCPREKCLADSAFLATVNLVHESIYISTNTIYTDAMSKRLVDIDDSVLEAAQAELGTATIKATVNEALRRAGEGRAEHIRAALDVLATAALSDRGDAWR